MERISRAKNRMRQSRSSGTVGGEGGNLIAYPANLVKLHNTPRLMTVEALHFADDIIETVGLDLNQEDVGAGGRLSASWRSLALRHRTWFPGAVSREHSAG
jgi:hypothetical protein